MRKWDEDIVLKRLATCEKTFIHFTSQGRHPYIIKWILFTCLGWAHNGMDIIFTWSGLADVGVDIIYYIYTVLFMYNICMPGVGGCLVFCRWRCSAAARLPARGGAELRLWRQLRRSVCQEPAARQHVTQWRCSDASDGDAQHDEDAGAGRRAGPPVGHGK